MKKIITAALILLISCSVLAGCGNGAQPGDTGVAIEKDGEYTTKGEVAQYILEYGDLPDNFITKQEARELGWEGGSLEPYAPGKSIGGDRFGNYEKILPEGQYQECDIDTKGADSRGAKRIVFSQDGQVYYTEDHYKSFEEIGGDQ